MCSHVVMTYSTFISGLPSGKNVKAYRPESNSFPYSSSLWVSQLLVGLCFIGRLAYSEVFLVIMPEATGSIRGSICAAYVEGSSMQKAEEPESLGLRLMRSGDIDEVGATAS